MNRFSILIGLIFISFSAHGQSLTTTTYSENTANVANPERGLYEHTQSHSSAVASEATTIDVADFSYATLTTAELDAYVQEDKRVILRVFYIHEHVASATIPSSYTDNMQTDFDAIRASGMKAVIRFAYSNTEVAADRGATAANIETQLQSLQPILEANKDVILAVQAGFVGTWGEWYYTSAEFGDRGVFDDTQKLNRYRVIDALLANVPESIQIQIRETKFKRFYLDYLGESTAPISAADAFDVTKTTARLGHHNDCVLSEPDLRTHEITIPKASLSLTGSTISLGYRAMSDVDGVPGLWDPTAADFNQVPTAYETIKPMATYTLTNDASAPSDWSAVPDVVDFPPGAVPEFKVADDVDNIYIRVTESGYLAAGKDRYEILINSDGDATTGWVDNAYWDNAGADFLLTKNVDIAPSAEDSTTVPPVVPTNEPTVLYAYSGGDNSFTFTEVATASVTAPEVAYSDAYSDRGSYSSVADLDWVAEETQYVISGGETCAPTEQSVSCGKAQTRLGYHHYTYLNKDYNIPVINKWIEGGCFDDITSNLGYRIKINSATIQDSANVNGALYVSLDLENLGYAAPSKARILNLVLKDTVTSLEYNIPFSADVRTWQTGSVIVNESLTVPADVPSGATYDAYLSLPDSSPSLESNSNYSIQLANTGIWDANTGHNNLNHSVSITSGTTNPNSTILIDGSLTDWNDVPVIGYGVDTVMKASDSADDLFVSVAGVALGDGFNLYIDADAAAYTGYLGAAAIGADYRVTGNVLSRFDYQESWVDIGTVNVAQNAAAFEVQISKSMLYGLTTDAQFAYENLSGASSDGVTPVSGNLLAYTLTTPAVVDRPTIAITADASSADWIYVEPLLQKTDGSLNMLKVFDDQTNVYVMVKGAFTQTNPNQIFLNTDEDSSVGFLDLSIWETMGADYAYLTDILYQFTGTTQNEYVWTASGSVSATPSSELTTREYVFPKSSIGVGANASYLDLGYRELDSTSTTTLDKIPTAGGLLRYKLDTESLATDLTSLTLSDDDTTLVVTVLGSVITTTYDAFLDTDNNAATGYSAGDIAGADFLVSSGGLFSYNGTGADYTWVQLASGVIVTDATGSRELSLDKTILGLPASGTTLNAVYFNTVDFVATAALPEAGMQSYLTTGSAAQNLSSLTLSDDASDLVMTILGDGIAATYDAFIDIDDNATTGYSAGEIVGADFLISTGGLFSYGGTGTDYVWTQLGSGLSVSDGSGSRALSLTKSVLGLTTAGSTINVLYQNTENFAATDVLPTAGMQSYVTTTGSSQNLSSLNVSDDANSVIITILGDGIAATYDSFIDVDNSAATGYSAGEIAGADFLVSNGVLFSYSGTGVDYSWTQLVSGIAINDGADSRVLMLAKSVLGVTSSGSAINVLYQNTENFAATDVLPISGMQGYVTTTSSTVVVTGITVSSEILSLDVSATAQLTANIVPTAATNQAVLWGSSDAAIATVSADGLVTAIANGAAVITLTSADGGFTATSTVSVATPVTGVTLTPAMATLVIGDTTQLSTVIAPVTASDLSVTWGTSDATVATVSATGLVTVVGDGIATITVTTTDGSFTAAADITTVVCADAITPYFGINASAEVQGSAPTLYATSYLYLSPEPQNSEGTWTWLGPNGVINNNGEKDLEFDPISLNESGTYTATYLLGACTYSSTYNVTVNDPAMISLRVEAENYTAQSGTTTEATSDVGGGVNVKSIRKADFLSYTLDIPVDGVYAVSYRIATSKNNAKLKLKLDDGTRTITDLPNTGGDQLWETVTQLVYLNAGTQALKVSSRKKRFNLNWFEVAYESTDF